MPKHILWILNGIALSITLVFLFAYFAPQNSNAVTQNIPLLGPASATPMQATHLAFVTYSINKIGADDLKLDNSSVSILAYELSPEGTKGEPIRLFSQPDPTSCVTDQVHPAPNGQSLILEYNCEADQFVRLLTFNNQEPQITSLERSYFLDWAPDSNWFLVRQIDEDQIWMMPTSGDDGLILNLPVGTYNATFTPDGQSIVYASTIGLGFGSELGILNLSDGDLVLWQQLQDQVFAFPRWSPDGTQLTYILIPDNNTPYTVGELWLADVNGKPLMLLDEVDAGHGYSPIWNPDSSALVYIRRENPASLQADHRAEALHSNLYQINLETYEITPLTQFTNTLVYDAVWSPDGSQLTFTVADTIWLLEPNHTPIQISSSGISRHSAWISLPNP